jgi:hypothetical protein
LERVPRRVRLTRDDTIRDVTVEDPVASKTTANATKPKSFAREYANVRVVRTVLRIFQVVFQMGMQLSSILRELGLLIDRRSRTWQRLLRSGFNSRIKSRIK